MVERLVPYGPWELFQRVVPEPPTRPQGGGRRRHGDREVLAAIIFVATTGCTWARLPPVFGPSGSTARWSRAMRAWVADQGRLTLERLPAYAPELNPVEMLWSAIKTRESANVAGDHLADVADAAERGIDRVCEDNRLPWPFLVHTGLEIHPLTPHN